MSEPGRLAAILRVQHEILAPDEFSEITRIVAARILELTGAAGAAVALADGVSGELVYRSAAGTLAPFVGESARTVTDLSGAFLYTGHFVCDDTETDPRVDRAAARMVGARSFVAIALPRILAPLPPLYAPDPTLRSRSLDRAGKTAAALIVTSLSAHGFDGHAVETLELMIAPMAAAIASAAKNDALRALRENEERFRLTIEHAPIGMALVALDGRWVRVNQRLCEIVGYSAEELVTRRFQDLTHPEDLDRDLALVDALLRGDIPRYRLAKRYICKRGTTVDAMLHVSLLRDDAGAPRYFISEVEDVTERKRLETHLALSDRMASIGTLASGIAHEINNPLTYVLSNLESLAADLGAPSSLRGRARDGQRLKLVEEARVGADRVRKIVRNLKTFSRADVERRVPLDIHTVLEVSIAMAFNEIRHRARLEKDFGRVPLVLADESRLAQVFINLLVNAAQAIDEGHANVNEIRVATTCDACGRAVIEVRDTGRGIAANDMNRIFDPFFTTKDVGAGTGLGLSISHAIVTSLGGEISARSEVGKGTAFRVTLPAAEPLPDAEPPRPDPKADTPPVPAPRGRLLVIDDDPLVALALQRSLGGEHDVVIETHGSTAIKRLHDGERYDVILCDLMMPQTTGMDVYRSVSEVLPAQAERFVFITGGAFTPASVAFLDSVTNARLEKPFELRNMCSLIDRMVAGDAPR